jgi:hypothetical protein
MELIQTVFDHYLVTALAAVVLALIILAFKGVRAVLLRLINRAFPVPLVDGSWETEVRRTNSANERHENVKLSQFANKVWGTAIRIDGKGSYELRGEVFGERLSLTYRQNKPGNDMGAILLRIQPNGRRMEGLEIGCDLNTGAVNGVAYVWTKRP